MLPGNVGEPDELGFTAGPLSLVLPASTYVFEIASKCARSPRNDSEKTVDSFCFAGNSSV